MLPTLQIGPLAIQLPGLILIASLWLGLTLAEKYSHQFGIQLNDLYNLSLIAIVTGIIGARLSYVLRFPTAFTASPISLISLNPGLLDPAGGFVVGLIAALIYGQRKSLPLLPTLDAIMPMLAVLNIGISLANLASGKGFGVPTNLPWGIELWGTRRHPTQIYNAIAALVILILFWPDRGFLRSGISGVTFFAFTACAAGARLVLDAYRADSPLTAGGLHIPQVIAWLTLAFSLVLIGWMQAQAKNGRPEHSHNR